MEREVTLTQEIGQYMNHEWVVRWGGVMLLHSSKEERAREVYERYKANPPKEQHNDDEIIFQEAI